ncbi:reticulocalbin-2 isoform 2-T2 [Discoglossus pictus]
MRALVVLVSVCLGLCASHKEYSDNLPEDDHYEDGEHNAEYDKKMFLGGEDEVEHYNQLSPEDQLKRLNSIIQKIDVNSDGFLTEDELSLWIQKAFKHYIREDTKEQFAEIDQDKDGIITWEEYNMHMYDRIIEYDEDTVLEDEEEESFRLIHLKDKRRFEHADMDTIRGLNLNEFTDFEHPEESDHMSEFVIDAALEEHDKDNDGFVSLDEFIGDYSTDPGASADPHWLVVEKDRFVNDYDKDGDGRLSPKELLSWIVPNNEGVSLEEADHLIDEIDKDGDRKLSTAEILQSRDIFLTSEATDYGRQLLDEHFYHDEL